MRGGMKKKKQMMRDTHPLHATLDDWVLDADELCEFSLEDHDVLMEKVEGGVWGITKKRRKKKGKV